MATCPSLSCWGRLLIPGTDGAEDLVYSIEKPLTVIGRDQKCDIRIVNREVSRKHVQLAVDTDTGCVTLSSLGREPVSVNGEPAADPIELFTGDQIEVHLEGRSRLLVFETDGDETLVLAPSGRKPLAQQDVNNPCTGPLTIGDHVLGKGVLAFKASSRKRGRAADQNAEDLPPRKTPRSSLRTSASRGAPPPPPPPPPPLGDLLKKAGSLKPAVIARKPANAPAPGRLDPLELENALKAGIAGLRKPTAAAAAANKLKATPNGAKKAAFVPDSEELLKLRARLRKTSDGAAGGAGRSPYCDFLGKGASPAPLGSRSPAVLAQRAPTPRSARRAARRKTPLSSKSQGACSSGVPPAATPARSPSLASPEGRRSSLRRTSDIPPPAELVMGAESGADAQTDVQPAAAFEGVAEAAAMTEAGEEDAVFGGRRMRPANKRKTVRFSLPLAVTSSPEGVPRDMTFDLSDATLQQCGEVVHVEADNTMAISAWAMGSAGTSSHSAEQGTSPVTRQRSATGSPALPHIPEDRRRSGSRLRHSSGSDLPLAPIAEEHGADGTPGAFPAPMPGRRSISSRPPTPGTRRSTTPAAPKLATPTAHASAGAPDLAGGTPASLLRLATTRSAGARQSIGRAAAAAGLAMPTSTPTAGQSDGQAGEPDAHALAMRLQEVAAAQVELTVELPANLFASPQGDLTLRAAPTPRPSEEVALASPAPAHGCQTTPLPQQEMAVFHVVADGAQPGPTHKASPSRLTMHVPLAALPSPVASDVTLRIPKEALEEAGRADDTQAAAAKLTVALAQALGAVPAGGSPAARLLQGVGSRAQKRVAEATVSARLAATRAQKLAAAAATAERRAAKLHRHNATLTKLLAREHGKRVEAEAALAALAATVTERVTGGPPPPSPITVRRGSPAAAAAAENALTAHVSKVRAGRTPLQRERQTARIAAATAPTPVLPRWPFISPCGATPAGRRSGAPAPAEEVPQWLFCGEPLADAELAQVAREIDESAEVVAEALGCAAEEAESPTALAPHSAASAEQPAEREVAAAALASQSPQQPRIMVEVAGAVQAAPEAMAAEEQAPAAAEAPPAAAQHKGDDTCLVCGKDAGKKVMLLCDGCDAPTHLACTQPRLRRVPKGDWFCAACCAGAAAGTAAGVPPVEPAAAPAAADAPAAMETGGPGANGAAAPEAAAAEAAAAAPSQAARPAPAARRARRAASQEQEAAPVAAPPRCATRKLVAHDAAATPARSKRRAAAAAPAEPPARRATRSRR